MVMLPEFVNREEEINLIEDRIGTIRYGGSVFKVVINFYGVVGIGKTYLLKKLRELILDKELPCAYVDLAERDYSAQDRLLLLEDLADRLPNSADGAPLTASVNNPEGDLQTTLEAFLNYIDHLTRQCSEPVVFLFDTLEKGDQELLDWLEDAVISPLIQTDRVLVVVASRAAYRWKRFEVRRRSESHQLGPFSEKTTERQLPSEYNALAPKFVQLTHGHPFGNSRVLESVRQIEQEVGRPLHPDDFENYQKRLIQELVDKLIVPHVMEGVSSEIRRACRVMALARQFDVNMLRRLLTQFVEDPFAGKSAAYFLRVVGEMVKTTLVEWSSDRKGYKLDDTIRWMLALNMRLLARERYEEINRKLIELYTEWINEVPENRSGFIIERLYHEACLQSVQGVEASVIADQLCELLKDYLEKYYPIEEGKLPHQGLTALMEDLAEDTELLGFLSADRRHCLVETIENVVERSYR